MAFLLQQMLLDLERSVHLNWQRGTEAEIIGSHVRLAFVVAVDENVKR
jgi:hypothetical protein